MFGTSLEGDTFDRKQSDFDQVKENLCKFKVKYDFILEKAS